MSKYKRFVVRNIVKMTFTRKKLIISNFYTNRKLDNPHLIRVSELLHFYIDRYANY